MLRNLHYLKNLNDTIIDEIICHMEVKRYAKDSVILKNGDVSNKLMFLREGEIEVKVSNQISQDCEVTDKTELKFDILNTVSYFCFVFNHFYLGLLLLRIQLYLRRCLAALKVCVQVKALHRRGHIQRRLF